MDKPLLTTMNVQKYDAPAKVGRVGKLVSLDFGTPGTNVSVTMPPATAMSLGLMLLTQAEELEQAEQAAAHE